MEGEGTTRRLFAQSRSGGRKIEVDRHLGNASSRAQRRPAQTCRQRSLHLSPSFTSLDFSFSFSSAQPNPHVLYPSLLPCPSAFSPSPRWPPSPSLKPDTVGERPFPAPSQSFGYLATPTTRPALPLPPSSAPSRAQLDAPRNHSTFNGAACLNWPSSYQHLNGHLLFLELTHCTSPFVSQFPLHQRQR